MAKQLKMETQRPAGTVVPLNRDRISTHVRNLLREVAPERIDALLPIIERCVTQAVAPPQERAFASRSGPLSTAATSAGADLMARATELPFPEFVAKLITGTFDAIVAAHIKQTQAYAELVAELAKTVKEFESSNVTNAQINEYLAQNYPDGSGGTTIKDGSAFDLTLFTDLVDTRLKNVWSVDVPKPDTPTGANWDAATVTAIEAGIKRLLARTGLDQLRAMAHDGMQFVAVTDGDIHAKLTFNVSATDEQATASNEYETQQKGFNVGGSAAWRWLRINAGYGSSTLRVKSVNERTFNKVTMDAQLVGEVTLHFQTRTLPAIA